VRCVIRCLFCEGGEGVKRGGGEGQRRGRGGHLC